jgi:hypothetical protein
MLERIEFEGPVPVLETSRRQVSVTVSEQLDERPRRPVLKPASWFANAAVTGGLTNSCRHRQQRPPRRRNLASAWKLPAVFVLEDNGYAESTASSWSIGGGDPIERAENLARSRPAYSR